MNEIQSIANGVLKAVDRVERGVHEFPKSTGSPYLEVRGAVLPNPYDPYKNWDWKNQKTKPND